MITRTPAPVSDPALHGAIPPLDPRRLSRAKAAYTTRYVAARMLENHCASYGLLTEGRPRAGDVVLARVTRLGQHERLEDPHGRRSLLYVGDEVFVAYGPRYAPDQFEAEIPGHLGPTHLVAAGGVAATVVTQHSSMRPATELQPVGLLADAAGVLTLDRCAPFRVGGLSTLPRQTRPLTIAVLGTSMNSGKTTTVASLVRGLSAANFSVAAGKVTGTGAGGDPGLFRDSGAFPVLDFTHFGYPSTYQLPHDEVVALLSAMRNELAAHKPDVVILEIADGLFQRETARLIADPAFAQSVDAVVFAAAEALGAVAGLEILRRQGLPVCAVSGLLTASPLAAQEARGRLDVPVLDRHQLGHPDHATTLLPLPSPLTAVPDLVMPDDVPASEPVAV